MEVKLHSESESPKGRALDANHKIPSLRLQEMQPSPKLKSLNSPEKSFNHREFIVED